MMKLNNKKGGFTLIEVLAYIGVFSIIVIAIISFVLWSVHSSIKTRVMRETLYNTRRSLEIMTYEIKTAKSISASSTVKHLYLENATTTEFYLCGSASSTLCQKKGAGDPAYLTSDKVEVKNLEFIKIATSTTTPSIQINLKVNYKNPTGRPEYKASVNATSTASLRSY